MSIGLQFKAGAKLPVILQNEIAECGHACIAMIGNYFGHSLDITAISKISPSSHRGVSLREIISLLDTLGCSSRAVRIELESLKHLKTPAILHWNMNHFVVLKRVTAKYIIIHDPAYGLRRCTFEEASEAFTGIALEVDKAQDFTAIKENKKLTLFALVKTVKGIGKFVAFLLLLSLIIELLSLINPIFIQYVTDQIVGSDTLSNLYVVALAFAFLVILQSFASYIRANMTIFLTNHLTEQFSSNIIRHLLKLPLDFFEKRHKGDLQAKFQSVDQIQRKISMDFINTALDGFMVLITILVMMMYSLVLTSIVLFCLFIFLMLRFVSYHMLRRQTEPSVHQHAAAASIFLETLQAIIPIKSFLKENTCFNTWRNAYINSLNADIKIAKMDLIYQSVNQLLFNIEQIVVIVLAVSLVLSEQFSAGMLMAFLSYRLMLVNKASSFIHSFFEYKLISVQLNRLADILFQPCETPKTGNGRVNELTGALTLKNIAFTYHTNERNVFQNITLEIKACEKVAIIGASGCGKSTLLKVMMGLLNPHQGDIFLDDIPLTEFGLKNYRSVTAAVMQDDSLLSGSILNNITFFDEDTNLSRVYEVAKLAFIHDIIRKMPMAYETLVGDMGSSLSGGQRQRILLARALYKQPKILFLDEATSHLDAESERAINQALKSLRLTQIVIAHRQETIQMADRVIDLSSYAAH